MIWLIVQMAGWLLLTMAFFALIGWSWAAERAAPAERALARERENLVRDIIRLSAGGAPATDARERERESDSVRRLLELRDARIAELQQQLDTARARAHDLANRLSEIEHSEPASDQAEEHEHLRGLLAQHQEAREREVEVEAHPVDDEERALQAWRLRYFEQRVRYLEGLTPAPAIGPELEWRAREAEARAAHLADEVRSLAAAPPAAPEQAPFAANAEIDMMLRWRMLYLERRLTYALAKPAPIPATIVAPDPDIWKWRSRYLEARVRHLELRPALEPALPAASIERAEPQPAEPPGSRGEKPPVLSAPRHGLPDDFTLIEGLSPMQQSTLNALGVFHFEQIAAWTPDHVAWVDRYLYLRGRIEEEEWVEQAGELMREGVAGARRSLATEEA